MSCFYAQGRFVRVRNLFVCVLMLARLASTQTPTTQTSPNQNSERKIAPGEPDPSAISSQGSSAPQTPAPQSSRPMTDTQQNPAPNPAGPQTPVEFESHGLTYEALTRNGITVMFASLPPHIKDFNIIQITITNGSLVSWTVKPADFTFVRPDGTVLQAISADDVIESLLERASRNDVIKLQLMYEDSIYALSNFRSTNGYEKRREAAMAQFVKPGFKAAAAASAITLVPTKLKPGDSTDGAIFFETRTKEKSLGPGRLISHTCGETFEFVVYSEVKLR